MLRNTLLTALILLVGHSVLAVEGDVVPSPDTRPTKTWTRTGPLGETPKHVTDACPLSDQENKGGWAKIEALSDEFDGKDLDLKKWTRGLGWWKGRQPALFSDKNVTVSDGMLHLTMRKEEVPEEFEKQGYKDYTSACLYSKVRAHYGYYEVKAKPMDSAGSSSSRASPRRSFLTERASRSLPRVSAVPWGSMASTCSWRLRRRWSWSSATTCKWVVWASAATSSR